MKILSLLERKELVKKFVAFDYHYITDDSDIFGVIYKITNLKNGKVYIGKTSRFYSRMMEHIRGALDEKYDTRSCSSLYNAMRSDGIENFVSEIIYTAETEEDLLEMEIRFIVMFKSLLPEFGYNMTVDRLLYSRQKSSSEKRSRSHKNKKHTKTFLKKNSNPIAAIHLEKRMFIRCDGCTLFGRYFFKDKDKSIFSHCVKNNSMYKGWYLLSLNNSGIFNHINNLECKISDCKNSILKEKLINFKLLYEIIANRDLETIERDFDLYNLEYANDSSSYSLTKVSSRVI